MVVEAVLELAPGGDPRAIGGAVTLALCGAFEHPGACPIAPHHTSLERHDGGIRTRIVAACEGDQREAVLRMVTAALDTGCVIDPDGAEQRWTLRWWRVGEPLDRDRALADRLASAP